MTAKRVPAGPLPFAPLLTGQRVTDPRDPRAPLQVADPCHPLEFSQKPEAPIQEEGLFLPDPGDPVPLVEEEWEPTEFSPSQSDTLTVSMIEAVLIYRQVDVLDTLLISLTDAALVIPEGMGPEWFLDQDFTPSGDAGVEVPIIHGATLGSDDVFRIVSGNEVTDINTTQEYRGKISALVPGNPAPYASEFDHPNSSTAFTTIFSYTGDEYAGDSYLDILGIRLWKKTGPTTWTSQGTLSGQHRFYCSVVFGGLAYLGTEPSSGNAAIYSWNGSSLSLEETFMGRARVSALCEFTGKLYALVDGTSGNDVQVYSSVNGSDWTLEEAITACERGAGLCVYDSELFAAVYTIGGARHVWSSSDGSTWALSHSFNSASGNHHLAGLVSDGTLLYAGLGIRSTWGGSTNAQVWIYDGASWMLSVDFSMAPFNDINPSVTMLAYDPITNKVYAATGDLLQNFDPLEVDPQLAAKIYVSPSDNH